MKKLLMILPLVLLLCFAFVGITVLSSTTMFAQEWSNAQKEIWSIYEKGWELEKKKDLEGLLSNFHPNFRGWYSLRPLPHNKDEQRENYIKYFKSAEILEYDLNPLAIDIHRNVVCVHYNCTVVIKDSEGEHKSEERWTSILMKEGEKWLIICNNGGPYKTKK